MEEKKIYNAPEIEIIEMNNTDVITASGISGGDGYSQYYPDPSCL